MKNLHIIRSTEKHEIAEQLPGVGAHFTNGTYAYSAEMIVPTTLVGFGHVYSQKSLPLVVAVNSDKSMVALGKEGFESQLERANKVAIPLAEKFPETQVYVIFYDEKTPVELYQILSEQKLTKTLHKWGYGTTPGEPKIEGAEFFDKVYAYPLPNDTKPLCYHETNHAEKYQENIEVVDLRDQFESKDAAYANYQQEISEENLGWEEKIRLTNTFLISHNFIVTPNEDASIHANLARWYFYQGDYINAEKNASTIRNIPCNISLKCAGMYLESAAFRRQNNFDKAINVIEEAITYYKSMNIQDHDLYNKLCFNYFAAVVDSRSKNESLLVSCYKHAIVAAREVQNKGDIFRIIIRWTNFQREQAPLVSFQELWNIYTDIASEKLTRVHAHYYLALSRTFLALAEGDDKSIESMRRVKLFSKALHFVQLSLDIASQFKAQQDIQDAKLFIQHLNTFQPTKTIYKNKNRFNIALVPDDESITLSLKQFSKQLSAELGIYPDYCLSNKGIPHISIFQFEMEYTAETCLFGTAKHAEVSKIKGILENVCKAIGQSDDDILLGHINNPLLHMKHDADGVFDGISWIDMPIIFEENPDIYHLHEVVYSELSKHQYHCLNAHLDDYKPHITLMNFISDLYEVNNAKLMIPTGTLQKIKNIPFKIVVGEANENWELTNILDKIKTIQVYPYSK